MEARHSRDCAQRPALSETSIHMVQNDGSHCSSSSGSTTAAAAAVLAKQEFFLDELSSVGSMPEAMADRSVYRRIEPQQSTVVLHVVLANQLDWPNGQPYMPQQQQKQQNPRKRQADSHIYDATAAYPEQDPQLAGTCTAKRPKVTRKGKYLLWQFLLLDLLGGHSDLCWHPDQPANPGVFAFKDPNSAAKRWGRYKENENMSYEKMSRCIRDYYIRQKNHYFGVMQPDPLLPAAVAAGGVAPGEDSCGSGGSGGGGASGGSGKSKRRRLHFAFNLRQGCVAQFIRQHAAGYYHRLVNLGLVDAGPAAE